MLQQVGQFFRIIYQKIEDEQLNKIIYSDIIWYLTNQVLYDQYESKTCLLISAKTFTLQKCISYCVSKSENSKMNFIWYLNRVFPLQRVESILLEDIRHYSKNPYAKKNFHFLLIDFVRKTGVHFYVLSFDVIQ